MAIGYHMVVARTQTLVQLNDELLGLLDERAARERRSRSALIREALEQGAPCWISEREKEIGVCGRIAHETHITVRLCICQPDFFRLNRRKPRLNFDV